MKKRGFVELLQKQGYEVIEKKLSGGFTNEVKLIIASKGGHVFEYVSKKYKSKKELKNMMKGYRVLSSVIKAPEIIYCKGREIAYPLIKGKNIRTMILENDPKAPEAIRLLAKELEKLHRHQIFPPKYRWGDSPDERKMIKHIKILLEKGRITKKEAEILIKRIREYIPKNKTIIHGDAHLGNFIYSEGKIYFIDLDNINLSDYNVDIGKIIYEIESLAEMGKITPDQALELKKLFLDVYEGEDLKGVALYKARTPLIQLKYKHDKIARKMIRKIVSDRAIVVTILITAILIILLMIRNNLEGQVIRLTKKISNLFFILIIGVIIGIVYLILKKTMHKPSKGHSLYR